MPSSPIRKLAKYADAAKRNGVHVYHLNIGQPDILTPECALEAVRNIDRKVLEYSPSQGYKSLRTKMVGYYAEYGIDLSPDEIIVTTGGSEAVMFAYMACLNPGDEIIVTDPSYANYMAFAIIMSLLSIYCHRSNILRLIRGEENIRAYYAQMITESRWLQRLILDLLELYAPEPAYGPDCFRLRKGI
mgnify:CR=1 FL=1